MDYTFSSTFSGESRTDYAIRNNQSERIQFILGNLRIYFNFIFIRNNKVNTMVQV